MAEKVDRLERELAEAKAENERLERIVEATQKRFEIAAENAAGLGCEREALMEKMREVPGCAHCTCGCVACAPCGQ